jgi:hypothetical protein
MPSSWGQTRSEVNTPGWLRAVTNSHGDNNALITGEVLVDNSQGEVEKNNEQSIDYSQSR